MKCRVLQDNLRKALWTRIEEGHLTGMGLAKQTGFKQAHISNFLNHKRNLSLDGMDKIMNVQRLSVLDLLDQSEINKRASILPPSEDEFDTVLLVDEEIAANSTVLMKRDIKDMYKFKRRFLSGLRIQMEGERATWGRFLLIRAGARDGMSMYPRLIPGSAILVDRHYNSLKPYRKGESNMYLVSKPDCCTIKYVEVASGYLVLRPHNSTYPVEIIQIRDGKTASDHIVGRVCHVGVET